jgi:uncharacterized repeat protein (TIGR01451 family)
VTCSLGDLVSGATATVTIVATATVAGTVTNTATVQSAVGDPDPTDNSASQSTTVTPSADLSIVKTGAPDPVTVGQNITYTLTVSNAGPSDATGVVVTDTLAAGLTFVSATSGQGTCTQASGTVTCDLGTLASGAGTTVTIVATVTAPGTVSNTASVDGAEPDPDPSDDTSTDDVTVAASADLSIDKTASPNPVVAGNTLTYTLTVSNAGPSDATGVVVTDPLPSGTTFVSASNGGTLVGSTVTWTIASIAAGSSVSLSLVVEVDEDVEGSLSNTATVDSLVADPDPSDDTDSIGVTVEPPDTPVADLSVEKVADDAKPSIGQVVTYTITISNGGPADATGIEVDEVLPDGLEYLSSKATQGDYDPETGSWDVGDLAVGDEATLTLKAEVTGKAGSTIDNLAEVSKLDQPDPDGANDSAEAAVEVSAEEVEPDDPPSTIVAYTGGAFGRLTLLMLLFGLLGLVAILGSRRLLRDGGAAGGR